MTDKVNRPPKKPKVVTSSTIEKMPSSTKLPSSHPKKGKGLMTGQGTISEKHPVLLREDLWYAIRQLLSIIKDDDYKGFGNHVI